MRRELLNILSDGQFHSGEALGAALGVSRMAVWKHLRTLREAGVELEVARSRGYRLAGTVELLEPQAIWNRISPESRAQLSDIEVFLEIASTSSYLREKALAGAVSGTVCLAEMQHAGRGRRNRPWISPFAANLYLSLLWRSPTGVTELGGFSLATGVAVLRCLRACGVTSVGLKWPNDLLADGAKLAGILIDVVGESAGPCAVIIGIGINVSMSGFAARGIDQDWTDLISLTGGRRISRNRLAACVLDNLLPAIGEFESAGLQPFMQEWREHDVISGHHISLQLPNETVCGKACGIDAGGALLVDTDDGRRRFASGEVSLRLA